MVGGGILHLYFPRREKKSMDTTSTQSLSSMCISRFIIGVIFVNGRGLGLIPDVCLATETMTER